MTANPIKPPVRNTRSARARIASVAKKATPIVAPLRALSFVEACVRELILARCQFSLDDDPGQLQLPPENGIYAFWVNFEACRKLRWLDPYEEIKGLWEDRGRDGRHSKFNAGRARRSLIVGIRRHTWIPLYLGKERNVATRVKQHITHDDASSTYSLKLALLKESFRGAKFAVGAVGFGNLGDAYFLCQLAEAAVRERLNPIIGRQ